VDDGNSSDVRLILPALEARGLRADFFVSTGRVGTAGFLDRDEIRYLASRGMGIGSHGMHHQRWRGLPAAELRREIRESRRLLSEWLGTPVREFACPFGSYDRRVLNALMSVGASRVYTVDRGLADEAAWIVPRNSLLRGAGPGTVRSVLRDSFRPLRRVKRGLIRAIKCWR
jgi:peptidoglycan/xylan/chitin deacetylase (PgdA/CDA1 family)